VNIDLQSEIRFGDRAGLLYFLNDHALAHQQYQAAAFTLYGISLPAFDMAEIGNPEDWKAFHYQIHRAINSTIKAPDPVDLLNFDLGNQRSFQDFMLNHRYLHDITDTALGL
jgi:hypothetical protein